jgi:hypothetical protein
MGHVVVSIAYDIEVERELGFSTWTLTRRSGDQVSRLRTYKSQAVLMSSEILDDLVSSALKDLGDLICLATPVSAAFEL